MSSQYAQKPCNYSIFPAFPKKISRFSLLTQNKSATNQQTASGGKNKSAANTSPLPPLFFNDSRRSKICLYPLTLFSGGSIPIRATVMIALKGRMFRLFRVFFMLRFFGSAKISRLKNLLFYYISSS